MNFNVNNILSMTSAVVVVVYGLYLGITKVRDNSANFQKKKLEKENIEKGKRKDEYMEFTNEFIERTLPKITEPFYESDRILSRKIDKIQGNLDDMSLAQKDLLRAEITRIYYKYLDYKCMTCYTKENLSKLYYSYKKLDGNSYVDTIYNEMNEWDVKKSEEEIYEGK